MSRSSKDKRQTNEPRHQTEVSPILGTFSVMLLVAVAVYLIAIGQYTEGVSTTLGAAIVLTAISLLNRGAMRQSE